MSSLSHRRSRGPTVTRDHANLSLVPFHGETKISQTCKTGEDSFAVGENEGISTGDTRGEGYLTAVSYQCAYILG